MLCNAVARGEFSYWSPYTLIQAVRSEQQPSRHVRQRAPRLGVPVAQETSVDIESEKEEKFLKIILGKADRIWGSPRFCKRRLLLQPSRGGAFAPKLLLLVPNSHRITHSSAQHKEMRVVQPNSSVKMFPLRRFNCPCRSPANCVPAVSQLCSRNGGTRPLQTRPPAAQYCCG